MTRMPIQLITQNDVLSFINTLKADGGAYQLVSKDGIDSACAVSLLGVLYMSGDHGKDMYLVNLTHDGVFPNAIEEFRKEN